MNFRYIGDGNEPPQEILFKGRVRFVLGEVSRVDLPEDIALLKKHQCFEEVADDERQANIEKLTQAGVTVDGRWGNKRLEEEVAKIVRNET